MIRNALLRLEQRISELRAARDAKTQATTIGDTVSWMNEPPRSYGDMSIEALCAELAGERATARILVEEFGDCGNQDRVKAIESELRARGISAASRTLEENRK